MVKKVLIFLLVVFIIIQFFRPEKNQNDQILASDITHVVTVPDSVMGILKVACYDCHSNNTRYPWYNNIQPVAWWMKDHIDEGKRELNFSEFGKRPPAKQVKKLKTPWQCIWVIFLRFSPTSQAYRPLVYQFLNIPLTFLLDYSSCRLRRMRYLCYAFRIN